MYSINAKSVDAIASPLEVAALAATTAALANDHIMISYVARCVKMVCGHPTRIGL